LVPAVARRRPIRPWRALDGPGSPILQESIPAHAGTIGLLLAARRAGRIAELRPLLDQLKNTIFGSTNTTGTLAPRYVSPVLEAGTAG
jgi:hypothetical protein